MSQRNHLGQQHTHWVGASVCRQRSAAEFGVLRRRRQHAAWFSAGWRWPAGSDTGCAAIPSSGDVHEDHGSTWWQRVADPEQRVALSAEFHQGGLGIVTFYDGGNVFPTIGFHDFTSLYSNNVGIGFRYGTPIGPIRIDLGRNLNPVPGISPNQYFITLGQAFCYGDSRLWNFAARAQKAIFGSSAQNSLSGKECCCGLRTALILLLIVVGVVIYSALRSGPLINIRSIRDQQKVSAALNTPVQFRTSSCIPARRAGGFVRGGGAGR